MNKLLFIFSILLISTQSAAAQSSKRTMVFSKDSIEKFRIHNYEKFSFKDSSGNIHEGKVFMPNDSQFYFINYFKEKSSRTFSIKEIYSIEYLEIPGDGKQKRQKMYLGPLAVAGILLFVPYVGPIYLIVREIYLYATYGPGHAYNPNKHKVIKTLKSPEVKIIRVSG